ncbi:unnamed protein product [Mytilus edulis]|uniref:Uncharacterized protein n=1 Tax=Mytilus edulis TaxID=6550 RepID=A0A8S3UJ89_MYTED|nr:unnamed protein product [Mytilus edulis]
MITTPQYHTLKTSLSFNHRLFIPNKNHFLSSWTGQPTLPSSITPLRPSIVHRPSIPSTFIRWALKLQEYKFDVIHRLGSRNQHCDALSRRTYEKQSEQTKVLTEITFIYPGKTVEQINNSEKEIPIFSLQDISSLQKQCPYFGPIITFLQNGTLPDNKNRAQAIPYETSQYELLNDTLYHFFQPRLCQRALQLSG